jgi:hypothetical protein
VEAQPAEGEAPALAEGVDRDPRRGLGQQLGAGAREEWEVDVGDGRELARLVEVAGGRVRRWLQPAGELIRR